MIKINRSLVVPYSCEQMFNLISDMEAYPAFLPWCSKSQILEKDGDTMITSLEVAASGMHQSFSMRNHLQPFQRIGMEHVDGPFKHLNGAWTFAPSDDQGCKIELNLDFEVNGGGLKATLFGMFFNKAADKMVDAFSQRAEQLFGSTS